MDFAYLGTVFLLVFGFGFVIFWHELGHFLAAKWAKVKVEQFAVGFGHAMFSWRKGMGFRWGSSRVEYEKALHEYLRAHEAASLASAAIADGASEERRLDYASAELGLGETEYRLNWIPLGGYVKMLGQDDMNPNATSESPNSYNNKPIAKRMVIVSAGVIMNIILAIIFFAILFRMGFDVPPPVVGAVVPGSPAQQAGVKVGDRVLTLDGVTQHDFTKISMNVALLQEGQAVPMRVRSADGTERELTVTPGARTPGDVSGFLRLGIEPSPELAGLDANKISKDWDKDRQFYTADVFAVLPGEVISAINGVVVKNTKDYYLLDEALQASFGKPVTLILKKDGLTREAQIRPVFCEPFGSAQVNFAGLVPRATVTMIVEGSSARGKLMPGDVVLSLTVQPTHDTSDSLSPAELKDKLMKASKNGNTVDLKVLRDGKTVVVSGLTAQIRLESGNRGLGIGQGYDVDHAVVGTVMKDSPADRAKLPAGATIISVNGQPVQSWFDIHRILRGIASPGTISVVASLATGEKTFELALGQSDLDEIASIRYRSQLALHELTEPRQTNNPLIAAGWGVTETRDLMVQFYLTLRRMVQGSVAASNAMGPIGIFHQGSKIANRGTDWLLWFLAMISANLAVVNFLPIPIVDGGLFVFLIVEKIMGKPLSPRAQSVAQIAGLALIASVFLFVTYHDITRLF